MTDYKRCAELEPVNYDTLTRQERREVRMNYIKHQGGMCHYCAMPLDEAPANEVEGAWINRDIFPKGFFDHPIHLHHDHRTGMTIGAVHARCNAYLWQYKGE